MTKFKNFADGLIHIANELVNKRNPAMQNQIVAHKIQDSEIRALLRTGLGSKIIRLKSGYAMNDTLHFTDKSDKVAYESYLQTHVKKAVSMMLAYGRACLVIVEHGADLSKPRTESLEVDKVTLQVLTPDVITVSAVDRDLSSSRYMKPTAYNARGVTFHHSRVVDFTYVQPAEFDLPTYQWGGVSEFELIRAQIINDGIVERASGAIVEKNSVIWHKIAGFKESVRAGRDDEVVGYYSALESIKSIYGAGIADAEDDIISVAQALTNLDDVDNITLRRLAMVTGIPLSILVGENVQGLNASGDNERDSFQDTIDNLQSSHILVPLNECFGVFGMKPVTFKDNQAASALERIEYDTKAISNARMLWEMGEDYRKYLKDKEVIMHESFDQFFAIEENE